MKQYSRFERDLAGILSKFPYLKLLIKKTYQYINAIVYHKNYKHKSEKEIIALSYNNEESFFGYYDKSPMNRNNTHIIFQTTNHATTKIPETKKGVGIVVYDVAKNEYEKIDTSFAYNWQQGTKLMWVNDDEFIYNNFDKINDKYISKRYNIKTKQFDIINYPVYDATEKLGIGLNFERLDIGRADYAYRNENKSIDWNDNNSDGLFLINFSENSSKLIISLENIISNNYKKSMRKSKHKFNHVMISPSGNKMMFMHRWFLPSGQRFDSLYVSNVDGEEIELIADDGMVSHCYWKNDNEIVSYMRDEVYGNNFYLIDLETKEHKLISKDTLGCFGDGHPICFEDKMIFDTYPNKTRMKDLFCYNFTDGSLNKLGEFYESMKYYGETRCDLHPKYSFDGKNIFIDSVHTGKRKLYQIRL